MPTKREAAKRYCTYRGKALQEATEESGAYSDWTGDPLALLEAILADARHLADIHGVDFGKVDHQAYQMYLRDKTG